MINVSFHTQIPDKLGYACRVVRKAYRSGAKVVVTASPSAIPALDKLLWTFDPLEFLPHVRGARGASASRFISTPISLLVAGEEAPHHDVLVNLDGEVAPGFESFKRVIELISRDSEDVQAGRRRWKYYADRGYALTHHEVRT